MSARYSLVLLIVFFFSMLTVAQNSVPQPTEFEIGRLTFFDFGPPFEYYELLVVRPSSNRTSVQRILLTPPADACTAAKLETASGSLTESVTELLGTTNPCTISEKELRRELKRCKKCLVFSGANVAMQVQCGQKRRIIRSEILDRDMFAADPKTPKHTSWSMNLLSRLDAVLGPGVMDKPIFPVAEDQAQSGVQPRSTVLEEVASGSYDQLFPGERKLSDLYRASQVIPPSPTVRLVNSSPAGPKTFVAPGYPPIARLAHIEGKAVAVATVGDNGAVTDVAIETGHPMLGGTIKEAVSKWTFPKTAANQQVRLEFDFTLNCPSSAK